MWFRQVADKRCTVASPIESVNVGQCQANARPMPGQYLYCWAIVGPTRYVQLESFKNSEYGHFSMHFHINSEIDPL